MKKIIKNKGFTNTLISTKKRKLVSGFTIIEVIIACTIISITIFALMSTASKGIELSNRALKQVESNFLMEEGAEAVKTIRDNNWETISNLSLETNYYLFFDTNTNLWSLNTSSITPSGSIPNYPIDGIFNRKIIISQVFRDGNDDIALVGTLDNKTKKVTVTVSWLVRDEIVSKSLSFYLTDIFN